MIDLLSWPVVVEITSRHVVWQEAASPDAAVDAVRRRSDRHYQYQSDAALDGLWAAGKPDRFDAQAIYDSFCGLGEEHGPVERCTNCGVVAHWVSGPDHRADCPRHEHRWSIKSSRNGEAWSAYCYCALRPGSDWPTPSGPGCRSGDFRSLSPALCQDMLVAHLRRHPNHSVMGDAFRSLSPPERAVIEVLEVAI